MSKKQQINIVYIDDELEEALGEYLDCVYEHSNCEKKYKQIRFNEKDGYEQLLNSSIVKEANVILIDSALFENDRVTERGKFTGEEFRVLLRKVYPFIEVIVISQNGENTMLDVIPKYRSETSESSVDYYNRILKMRLDERVERIITFRNIAKKLQLNEGIEKMLVEKTVGSLNGVETYESLTKKDIDKLIAAFQQIK